METDGLHCIPNIGMETDGRKFSKWLENTVGKGKIARYEQFLLVTSNFSFSHSVFKRLILQTYENQGLFGKGLSLSQTSPGFYMSALQVF